MLNQAATIFLRDNTRGEIWESSQHCNLMSTLHKACCGFADAYRRSRYFRWIVGCNKEYMHHNCFLASITTCFVSVPANSRQCMPPHLNLSRAPHSFFTDTFENINVSI